ncbi:hypothetical protein ACFSWE_01730 [Leucobacter albus]|uniref:DUF2975 domain-containing protein n=1 Tax=Leucobacter albus TaxID=272210 RepID=A0ABW3TNI2_9MICO
MQKHYDNHKEASPRIARTHASVTAAALTTLGAIGSATLAITGLNAATQELSAGRISAAIPLDNGALDTMSRTWEGDIDSVTGGFADVTVNGAPSHLIEAFRMASLTDSATVTIVALLALIAAVALFAGKLRWNTLASLTIAGGTTLAVGSFAAQSLATTAAEELSIWLYAGNSPWLEPGFLAGINFIPVTVGLGATALGIALRTTGKLATEADGVV